MKLYDVCLVTLLHPSNNPRLAKELRCLVEHGYRVHVVACKFANWADMADAEFMSLPCSWSWVRFGQAANPVERQFRRIQHFIARRIAERQASLKNCSKWLIHRASHPAMPALIHAAKKIKARLYIAHCVPALPIAHAAARLHNAKLGFDAEDYHRGQYESGLEKSLEQKLIELMEELYIPQTDYITAASEGIGAAYRKQVGSKSATTVLNVFPVRERLLVLPPEEVRQEKPPGSRSLYWISQTIGTTRGLENVLRALPSIPSDVVLVLRGNWQIGGYKDDFYQLARELGVEHRVHILKPVPSGEIVPRAACHEIGLAVESGLTINHSITISNKLFNYLAAGIPCVATDTIGQRSIGDQIPDAVRIVPFESPAELAKAVCLLLESYPVAKRAAEIAGREFCWENESHKFLQTYDPVLKECRNDSLVEGD